MCSRPFIPVPNCASVEFIYTLNGQYIENRWHVRKSSPFSAADLIALRNVFNTWDSTQWKNYRPTASTLVAIRCRALDSDGAPLEYYSLPTPRGGGWGYAQAPGNVTLAIKLATGLIGRSYRGRIFVPGVPLNGIQSGTNIATYDFAVGALNALNNMFAPLVAAGYTLGVVSYRNNKAWRAEGVFTPATTWTLVNWNLDSMRRRLTGRGT